eukprot:461525-Pyramimonas_sp.AAC.1
MVHCIERLYRQILEGGRLGVGICVSHICRPPACGRITLCLRRKRVDVCIHVGLGIIYVGRLFDRGGPCPCSSSLADI